MRFFIIILSFILYIPCHCRDNTKEFIKLIQQHDIPTAAREISPTSEISDFWYKVLIGNPILTNFSKDIKKGKGAEKQALYAVREMTLFNYRLNVDIIDDFRGYCDTLAMEMGFPDIKYEINIIDDETPNAFATLTKDGFAICLHLGLLRRLEYDYYRIMAVTAHEFAHGSMMHHLRKEYQLAKKERRDKIMAGIAIGLNAAAQVADAYAAGITGREYDADSYTQQYEKIAEDRKKSTEKFRYKYGRELEIEADLVAFRFMQFLGEEEKYLEALQMISDSDEYFLNSDESDHPSTVYRLDFLDFVSHNPEYTNEVKIK